MLNSKQRAKLRALANTAETIVHIGKGGINDNIIKQADEALRARELIKLRVLETAFMTAHEASDVLCKALRAEPVAAIGTRFVIYRENHEKPQIKLD